MTLMKSSLNEAILKQVLITKKTPKTYFFHLFLLKGKGPSSEIEKGPKTSTSRRIIWGRVWWWWRWWWCGGKLWWLRTVQHVFIKKNIIYAHLLNWVFFVDGTGKWKGLTTKEKGCRSWRQWWRWWWRRWWWWRRRRWTSFALLIFLKHGLEITTVLFFKLLMLLWVHKPICNL